MSCVGGCGSWVIVVSGNGGSGSGGNVSGGSASYSRDSDSISGGS